MSHRLVLRAAPLVALAAVLLGASWWGAAGATTATVDAGSNATYGSILTDAAGFALYTLDTDHNGMSTCTGSCAQAWPPLTVPAGTTPSAGPGVSGTVAAVLQSNGTSQVTFDGGPLYTFLSDTSPGQVTGNGVSGFSVVRLAAAPTPTTTPPATTAPAPPATTAPTTGSSGSSSSGSGSSSSASGSGAGASGPTAGGSAAKSGASSGTAPGASAPVAPSSSGSSSGSLSGSSSGGASTATTAPPALAFTGTGSGLRWLVVVGATLVVISLVLLLGSRRRLGRHLS